MKKKKEEKKKNLSRIHSGSNLLIMHRFEAASRSLADMQGFSCLGYPLMYLLTSNTSTVFFTLIGSLFTCPLDLRTSRHQQLFCP